MPRADGLGEARRILIYGVTGSGKTTLAQRLSEVTGIPWHSVDDLAYMADWKQVPDDVQADRIREICSGEEWILDTAYSRWMDIPLARAEVIVALDYPRVVSLSRLVRRTLARIIDQRPVCNGNRENWRTAFGRDSILLWHFRSFSRKRARIRAWAKGEGIPPVLAFKAPREADRWLEDLR